MEIKLALPYFKTKEKAHIYLKQVLCLPSYYGNNLDALYDCLTDIHEEQTIIIPKEIMNPPYLGTYGKQMLRVFEDAAKENPHLQILIK